MVSNDARYHYLPTGNLVQLLVELDDTRRMTRDCHVPIYGREREIPFGYSTISAAHYLGKILTSGFLI